MIESVPKIDISDIGLNKSDPSIEDYAKVGQLLDTAFREIGFVYLLNHGINQDIVKKGMERSEKFFLQDDCEKMKYKREINQGDIAGWVANGREYFPKKPGDDVQEIRESFDIFEIGENAKIPETGTPGDRQIFMELADESINLTSRLLKSLSLGLGKEIDFFNNLHRRMMRESNKTSMRTLYYPAIKETVKPGSIRCGEHTDYGTMTLLYQDEHPGLELKSRKGGWIQAPPLPGHLLINIGDLLEMWTNKEYPATLHRVLIPEQEILKKVARQSIVFFVHPDAEVKIEPLIGDPETRMPAVTSQEHTDRRFAETFKY